MLKRGECYIKGPGSNPGSGENVCVAQWIER